MVPEINNLSRYLHEAAIAEIGDKYRSNGYHVEKGVRIGDVELDMVAEKNNHRIYFAFKIHNDTNGSHKAILQVKQQADEDGAEFRLVFVSPPTKMAVDIDNIEERFKSYLEENMPMKVRELSTHTNIEKVSDVEIGSINIEPDCIKLKGSFALTVHLRNGSDGDEHSGEELDSEEAFVTWFEAELDDKLNVISLEADVDTSSWDE